MAERAQALIQKFQGVSGDFIGYIENLTDDQWQAPVANEKRTVGVVAHHVAGGLVNIAGAATMLANGQSFPLTQEALDQLASKHASEHATVTKAETVALLKQNCAASIGMIKSLTDEQLDNGAPVTLMGGQKVPAYQFAELVWIGHIVDHQQNIKAALGS